MLEKDHLLLLESEKEVLQKRVKDAKTENCELTNEIEIQRHTEIVQQQLYPGEMRSKSKEELESERDLLLHRAECSENKIKNLKAEKQHLLDMVESKEIDGDIKLEKERIAFSEETMRSLREENKHLKEKLEHCKAIFSCDLEKKTESLKAEASQTELKLKRYIMQIEEKETHMIKENDDLKKKLDLCELKNQRYISNTSEMNQKILLLTARFNDVNEMKIKLSEDLSDAYRRLELQTKSFNEERLIFVRSLCAKNPQIETEAHLKSEITKEELLQEKIKVKEIENEQSQNKLIFQTIESELRETIKNQRNELEKAHKELKKKDYGTIKQGLLERLTLKHEDLQEAMNKLVIELEITKEELIQEKTKVKEIENERSQNRLMFEKIESELRETIENQRNELEEAHEELKNKDFEYHLELKELNAELDKERGMLLERSQANEASLKMKDDKETKLCLETKKMKEHASRMEKELAQLLTEKSAISNKLKHNVNKHELFERLACKHEDLQTAMNAIMAASKKIKKELANEKQEFSEIKCHLEHKMGNLRKELEEANKRLKNKGLENDDLRTRIKATVVASEKELADGGMKFNEIKCCLENEARNSRKELEEADNQLRSKGTEVDTTIEALIFPSEKLEKDPENERKEVCDIECHFKGKLRIVKEELIEANSRLRNKDLENEDLKTRMQALVVALNKIKKELEDERKKFCEIKFQSEDSENLRKELNEANNQLKKKDIEHEIKVQELKAELNRKEETMTDAKKHMEYQLKSVEEVRSKYQRKLEVTFS